MELSPTPLRQNKCDKECDESHIPNRFLLLLLSSKAKAKLIWPKSCFRFRFCSYSARFFPTARNVLCPKFLATIWAVQFVPPIYLDLWPLWPLSYGRLFLLDTTPSSMPLVLPDSLFRPKSLHWFRLTERGLQCLWTWETSYCPQKEIKTILDEFKSRRQTAEAGTH